MSDGFVNRYCPQCGGELKYQAGKRSINCTSCKYERKMPEWEDRVTVKALVGSIDWGRFTKGYEQSGKEVACETKGCGAQLVLDADFSEESCPFCLQSNLKESEASKEKIRPTGLIPFTIPAARAAADLKEFLGDDLLRPGDLSSIADEKKLRGVYVPFWSLDAFTKSSWIAMVYYDLYEQPDEEKDILHWIPAWGYYEKFFNKLIFPASKKLNKKDLEKMLENFDKKTIIPFDPAYLNHWDVEIYQDDPEKGLEAGDKEIDKQVEYECAQKVLGDDFRELRVHSEKEPIAFHQYLFPVWVAVYSHKGKRYTYMINGQSGEVYGKKPYSSGRVGVLLGLVGIVLFLLILLGL